MKKFLCAANALLAVLLALGPFCLAPVCAGSAANGGHMKCWHSAVFITACGALLTLAAVVCLCRGGRRAWLVALFGAAAAAAVWGVPECCLSLGRLTCGWCAAADHACRAGTRPLTLTLAGALLALDVAGLTALFLKGGAR